MSESGKERGAANASSHRQALQNTRGGWDACASGWVGDSGSAPENTPREHHRTHMMRRMGLVILSTLRHLHVRTRMGDVARRPPPLGTLHQDDLVMLAVWVVRVNMHPNCNLKFELSFLPRQKKRLKRFSVHKRREGEGVASGAAARWQCAALSSIRDRWRSVGDPLRGRRRDRRR